jgi:hypothetical protein
MVGVAFLLVVAVTGLVLRTRSGGEDRVSAPPTQAHSAQPPAAESSPRLAVKALALPAPEDGAGVDRQSSGTVAPSAPVTPSTIDRRRPSSGVSRPARRPSPRTRAAGRQQTRGGVRSTSGRVSAPARSSRPAAAPARGIIPSDVPAKNQPSDPAVGPHEPAAPAEMGAQVSVSTSYPNSDELTFRWSAPVGAFADPTARQTRFFCPDTPQPVTVTVLVTDGKGAAASDTFIVQCVARKTLKR